MDHRRQRVQRLRRADVVGRLLAADVLLAGLQGEDEAAAAVDVLGFARDPPRHAPDLLLGRAEEAEGGPAEVEPVAERLALAEGDVGAALAGRLEDRRASSGRRRRPAARRAALAAAPSASTSSTAPRKLGLCRKTAAVSSSTASASAAASVRPSSRPTSTTSAPKPARVGGERLAAVRMDAAGDDEAAAPGRARSPGSRPRRPRRAPRRGRRWRPAAPVSSDIAVWNSNIDLQAALGDLRLVGRVGSEELGALGDRVDDRRHVVVVHPGAEEADLLLGVGVALGERREPLVDLGLAHPGGKLPAAGRGAAARGSARRAPRSTRRRSPPASRRGRLGRRGGVAGHDYRLRERAGRRISRFARCAKIRYARLLTPRSGACGIPRRRAAPSASAGSESFTLTSQPSP